KPKGKKRFSSKRTNNSKPDSNSSHDRYRRPIDPPHNGSFESSTARGSGLRPIDRHGCAARVPAYGGWRQSAFLPRLLISPADRRKTDPRPNPSDACGTIVKTPHPAGACCWILQSWPWKTEWSSKAGVLVRPPNDPAKSSLIPPLPGIRKSSPISLTPVRLSSSQILKSAITGPPFQTTKRPGHT